MNVFEGSYMNSLYSAHVAHRNEYKICEQVAERLQHTCAFKCRSHHQNALKSCNYSSNESLVKQASFLYKV